MGGSNSDAVLRYRTRRSSSEVDRTDLQRLGPLSRVEGLEELGLEDNGISGFGPLLVTPGVGHDEVPAGVVPRSTAGVHRQVEPGCDVDEHGSYRHRSRNARCTVAPAGRTILQSFSTANDRVAGAAACATRPSVSGVAGEASRLHGGARWLLGLCILGVSSWALGEDGSDYIYCSLLTSGNAHEVGDALSYTGVFPGDFYGSRQEYLKGFHEYLRASDSEQVYLSLELCDFEETREKAEERLLAEARESELAGHRVVYTNWTPDGGESDVGPFLDQPIRDISLRISGTEPYRQPWFSEGYTVDPNVLSICVRDHECEDGDKVSVLVNGNGVLTAEIVADWHCEEVTLMPGAHAIELRAVNGTGFKGEDCSHADVNTGEIMIASDREDSVQRWRHRGGAGSSATLNVTVE